MVGWYHRRNGHAKRTGNLGVLQSVGHRVGQDLANEQQQNQHPLGHPRGHVHACQVTSVLSWLFVTPWTIARQATLSWDSPGINTGVGCHAILQGDVMYVPIINNIIKSSFTSLKILYAPLTHPSLPLYPLQPLIFFPYSFFCLFLNVILLKLYSIWPSQTDFFHRSICIYISSMFFPDMMIHLFSAE